MFRILTGLVWLLVPLLAACNLNASADVSTQAISGAPQVQIISPLANATYLEGVAVNIQALITNAGADIDRVEVSVDDTVVASLPQPNEAAAPSFSITQSWPAAGTGSHEISVVALRGDGSASNEATVSVSVINQAGSAQDDTPTPESTEDVQASASDDDDNGQAAGPPTAEPEPTDEPEPEEPPTPDVPTATFLTGVNVRRGPDTVFDPPIGSFAANDTTEVLAVNPGGTWYKVRYYNGDGWVFANLMTVANAEGLPVEAGPPTPTPIPPTATSIPATATPQTNVNLVAGNITTDPSDITCGKTFRVFVDVANFGSSRSPGGTVRIEDSSNGLVTSTNGAFGEIEPGDTRNFGPIPLTVDTNHGAEHTLTLIVDPDNQVAETDENDNRSTRTYRLQRGDC